MRAPREPSLAVVGSALAGVPALLAVVELCSRRRVPALGGDNFQRGGPEDS